MIYICHDEAIVKSLKRLLDTHHTKVDGSSSLEAARDASKTGNYDMLVVGNKDDMMHRSASLKALMGEAVRGGIEVILYTTYFPEDLENLGIIKGEHYSSYIDIFSYDGLLKRLVSAPQS